MSNNETIRIMEERISNRIFTNREVHEDDMVAILQSANQAPSAHNRQPWRFLVVRGSRKQELVRLVTDKAVEFPKPWSTLLRMAARSISSAPLVVAVVTTGELTQHGARSFEYVADAADFFRTMEIQSSAAAVQNMLLAAASLGLASVWLGILYLAREDVFGLLDVQDGELIAVVPIGYALKKTVPPRKKSLLSIVSYLS